MTTETLTHEDCLDHRRGDCQGEVEFRMPGLTDALRVLVLESQLESVQEPVAMVA